MDYHKLIYERGCPKIPENPIFCHPTNQNKLNVYNWLENIPGIKDENRIVEIRFKNNRKEYFENPKRLRLDPGYVVAVEAQKGHDIGIVSLTGPLVFLNMKKRGISHHKNPLKKIYRHATNTDLEKWKNAMQKEKKTLIASRKIIRNLNLKMKLADIEYQGDNTKATFYYIADERVDFRTLIKVLAERFKIRIEMRQIGSRQEASLVGGIGPCGRELCCSTFMHKFSSVNTQAARIQDLSLNMQKLTGMCGKLKCCLNHELAIYEEARKHLPRLDIPLETKNGRAFFQKADVLKKVLWYTYENS
ncbi:MAG TPA: hypothetical protein EYP69_03575, partial [Bacteroidales bacterium]|nr:hypothetical protein [Bacteroidales bacterium]